MERHRLRRLLVAALVLLGAGATGASAAASDPVSRRLLLQSSSWSYQLQDVDVAALAATHVDVAVIDAFFGGRRADVERLKVKPTKARRIVLAYLSVGEAQVYRYYWGQCCALGKRPDWIGAENPRWRGNFAVDFWVDEWKELIYRGDASYLRRIVDLGFDGVYLDGVDAHARVKGKPVDARTEMVRFVTELAGKARSLLPGFLIVAQNGLELVEQGDYLAAIDGVAKEDLLYGADGDGRRNPKASIEEGVRLLARALEQGRHALVVEYLEKSEDRNVARTEIMEHGFVPSFAPRRLDRHRAENLEDDPSH